MKIAYISQAYPPTVSGASIMLKRLADGMARHGHSVLVLAPSDTGFVYTQMCQNLRVFRLKSIRNPKRIHQQFVPWSFNDVRSQLKAFRPDLIHTHDVFYLGIFGLIVGRQMGIPVIATIHQLPWFISDCLPDIHGLKSIVEGCLWKYGGMLNKYYQGMIVSTETISRTVHIHGGFRPEVITNGVDLQEFSPELANSQKDMDLFDKYHLNPELPIILHVGRLDSDKKVDVVIRAAAGVIRRIPAQLMVVGDGECRENLILLSKKLGIEAHTHFPGFLDFNTELPGIYRIANVFATASEIETQGLVLLEAIASGLPVVAVDATCIHEVVRHQINGYLIPPGDENGFTTALMAILRNPTKAQKMGEASWSIVQYHSSQITIDKHEILYRDMIRRYQPTPKASPIQRFFFMARTRINETRRVE